ncbi:MAG: hypothetical protein ACR2OZ_00820, partial [Verrucomicrobiales bacterium]
ADSSLDRVSRPHQGLRPALVGRDSVEPTVHSTESRAPTKVSALPRWGETQSSRQFTPSCLTFRVTEPALTDMSQVMTSAMEKLRAFMRQVAPLTIGLVIMVACLYQGRRERKYKHKDYKEAFPFSHYPMYSGFDPWEYYVYVADGAGNPLPLEKLTAGYKCNSLKKKFDDLIDEIPDVKNRDVTPEMAQPAGRQVLSWLGKTYPALAAKAPLRLYQVEVFMKDGSVVESAPKLIAEYTRPK